MLIKVFVVGNVRKNSVGGITSLDRGSIVVLVILEKGCQIPTEFGHIQC